MEIRLNLEDIASQALEKAEKIEYKTFSTSCHLPENIIKEEENTYKREGLLGKVALKTELNKEIRDIIAKRSGKMFNIDGEVNFKVDVEKMVVDVEIRPIFLLCKYRKFKRGISQTRWDKYNDSIEGFIVKAAEELYQSTNAFLHGSGREDVDARMLGDGRLCVIEIVNPKKRSIDTKKLEEKVRELSQGSIEISVLREVSSEYVWIVKEAHFDKEYEAEVKFEKEIGEEEISRIISIKSIKQRTPLRVKHRRADLVRSKNIFGIWLVEKNGYFAKFKIKAEAGTYIKELISGDNGRTRPSFAEAAGCGALCVALDVVKIHEYISEWW